MFQASLDITDGHNQALPSFQATDNIVLRYYLTNLSEQNVTIGFSSSQRVRAIFIDQQDQIKRDLDTGLMYMMALSEVMIESHSTLFFAVPLTTLPFVPGTYRVLAGLALSDITNQVLLDRVESQFIAETYLTIAE